MDIERLRIIFETCLSWILPQSPDVELIEKMSGADFVESASPPLDPPPEGIVSLFKYRDPLVEKAIWALKYKGNRRIAHLFAETLRESIIETLADEALFSNFTNPIIIPIPLSRERLKERGWNQSEMICRELAKLAPEFKLDTKVLIKKKHTVAQTRLSREARLKNLRGCFAVRNPSLIKNRNIILIDDVTTTGSTLAEARRTLLLSGAKRVLAFTIAH